MENSVYLKDVSPHDLATLFQFHSDPDSNFMVGFGAQDPNDEKAFREKWAKILADPTLGKKTIFFENKIAGYMVAFDRFGKREVGYWIGKEFWGKGIASRALSGYLKVLATRPLYARVIYDNLASIRVLEKCGFKHYAKERGFANARGCEVDETLFILEA